MKGKITRLLGNGLTLQKIAKITGKSYRSIWKQAQKYEREGIIERVCKYPALYRFKKHFTHSFKLGGVFTPLLLPHKFGASFVLVGRPILPYNKLGKATIKESSHSIQFGRSKAQIWLKSFRGVATEDIVKQGKQDLLDLAMFYSQKYGVKLSAPRFFPGIEWVVTDKKTGKKVADKCEIIKQKEIADAMFKFGDSTHPDLLEINQAPKKPPEKPTEHAKTMEYLLTKAPRDITNLQQDYVQHISLFTAQIKTHLEVLTKMSKTQDEQQKTMKEIRDGLKKRGGSIK